MTSAWSQFTKQVNTSLDQVRQLTTERLAPVDPDYAAKEQKLEKIKVLYETMLRLVRPLTETDYDPSLQESVNQVFGKMNEMVQQIRPPSQSQSPVTTSPIRANNQQSSAFQLQDDLPKTLSHAMAKAALHQSQALGENEPLGAALQKFGTAQDKLGFCRLTLSEEVANKFMQPFTATLSTNIQFALKAKKSLHVAKHQHEAIKTRFKNNPTPNIQAEMDKADLVYQDALKDAQYKIGLVVGSPESIRNLGDLVNALAQYHKESFDVLNGLRNEISEMQMTQEALYMSD